MAESTKLHNAKRVAYWNMLQKTLNARFPSFVEALRGQTPVQQHQGRTAIVKFRENEKPCVECTNTQEELQIRLSDSLENKGTAQRHLYIVEDLGRANIEILGSRLGIPPLFFAIHWEPPICRINMVDGKTLTQNRRQSFKLVFPMLYRFTSTARTDRFSSGQYTDSRSNLLRGIEVMDIRKEYEMCLQQVCFWSLMVDSESWIGVLLVDPPITEARLEDVPILRSLYPPPEKKEEDPACLPSLLKLEVVDSHTPGSPLSQLACCIKQDDTSQKCLELPVLRSTFENIKYFYEAVTSQISKDPVSAMLVSQRYVLQLYNSYVQSKLVTFDAAPRELQTRSYSEGVGKIWFDSWDWAWREEVFRRLTIVKANGQLMSKDIKYNMQALGIETGHTVLEECEIEGWMMLRDDLAFLRERLDDLIEAYIQTSTLQESQFANEQARNIGRLTRVATILLPLTVCTGVFSMSGEFLPGDSKFWVFWAWAIPCVSVFTLLAFTHPLHLLKQTRTVFVGTFARLLETKSTCPAAGNGYRRKSGLGAYKTEA